jgi:hypothetical protein
MIDDLVTATPCVRYDHAALGPWSMQQVKLMPQRKSCWVGWVCGTLSEAFDAGFFISGSTCTIPPSNPLLRGRTVVVGVEHLCLEITLAGIRPTTDTSRISKPRLHHIKFRAVLMLAARAALEDFSA